MTSASPAAVIILAAGKGTRMKSDVPKVMHSIGGRTLVGHALRAARDSGAAHVSVVVRHQREVVAPHVSECDAHAILVDQDEIPGTGRACECGLQGLPEDLQGTVLVTMGDVPLLRGETLAELTEEHERTGSAVTVITAELDDAKSYGRILRDADGSVTRIVEFKDALAARENGDEEVGRAVDVNEINSGIYAFDAALLREALPQLGSDNAQGEKYLTDMVQVARDKGLRVSAHKVADIWETEGVNDRVQLAQLGKQLNRRTCERLMREGVTIVDPDTTWIDADVTIGRDTTILPQTQLLGATTIGAGCTVGPDTTLTDMEVRDGASVVRTHGSTSVIGEGANVGPYTYLRPGTVLGVEGKLGAFVETKNAEIGDHSKVPHLSYIGDATIGHHSNIGCSSVFANYDGVNKHRTVIGDHCRLGSDTMYVAPVTVGDGAYSGAGTVIRKDVPPGALAITVAPQRNIEGWTQEHRPGTPAAEAAQAAQQQNEGNTQA